MMAEGFGEAANERRAATRLPISPPIRLAVVFVVASGLTLSSGCAQASGASGAAAPPVPAAPTVQAAPTTAPPAPTTAPAPAPAQPASTTLRLGDSGPAVSALQQRLGELGFWLGDGDGNYGQLTRQAVMAFQKVEGISRDGIAGPQTQQRLPAAARLAPRDGGGDRIEINLERQLLLVVRGGQVQWVFNTSTGNGEAYGRPSGGTGVARTPRGDFAFQRQINGLRRAELGDLYRPKYFRGGIAVHGSGSVPAQPASHGCVRLTNAAMDLLWSSGVAEIGTPVHVY
jgi:peptidoglycan hydrolase-like protein with peptidoglycan-binding domain